MPYKDPLRKKENQHERYLRVRNTPEYKALVKKHGQKWLKVHKDYINQRAKEYKKRNPEMVRKWYLKKKYGLSPETYQALLETQNNVCAICAQFEVAKNKRLHIDHHHETGKIRGLLCGRCNTALGLLKENLNLLENTIAYIKKHNG